MHILIDRLNGNKRATHGRLAIDGTTFACRTLEACDPDFAPVKNKTIMALPTGTYRMQFAFDRLRYTLRFSCFGTYHQARFEEGNRPADVSPGSVILGTHFNGMFQIDGSAFAMQRFHEFLTQQVARQRIDFRRLGQVTATITRSPDFRFDGQAEPAIDPAELDEEDWDMLNLG